MLAMLTLAAAVAMTQPLNLVLEGEGTAARLLVVGESAVPLTARYELEASGGNGNRSVQSGTVRLLPGQRVTLVSLSMSGLPETWAAKLRVSHDGGSYEQARNGD